jgi:hypothetical protein
MTARERALARLDAADAAVAQRLRLADAAVETARLAHADARAARAREIARALKDGWTLARIGALLGRTPQRIHQMRRR